MCGEKGRETGENPCKWQGSYLLVSCYHLFSLIDFQRQPILAPFLGFLTLPIYYIISQTWRWYVRFAISLRVELELEGMIENSPFHYIGFEKSYFDPWPGIEGEWVLYQVDVTDCFALRKLSDNSDGNQFVTSTRYRTHSPSLLGYWSKYHHFPSFTSNEKWNYVVVTISGN